MSNLREKALLITLCMPAFGGYKHDKDAGASVKEKFGIDASEDAGNYNKKLMPNLIKKINSEGAKLRNWFTSVTLPWDNNGRHIILSKAYLPFLKEFAERKAKVMAVVEEEADHLSEEIEKDKKRLSGLWKITDYPTRDELISKYTIKLFPEQIPNNEDFRADLNQADIDQLKVEMGDVEKERQDLAMKKLWGRVFEAVNHLVERIDDPDETFKNATITKIQRICDMMPSLNIEDNEDMKEVVKGLQENILTIDPDDIRYDSILRKKVNTFAKDILDKITYNL
jgi:hypothetical protein